MRVNNSRHIKREVRTWRTASVVASLLVYSLLLYLLSVTRERAMSQDCGQKQQKPGGASLWRPRGLEAWAAVSSECEESPLPSQPGPKPAALQTQAATLAVRGWQAHDIPQKACLRLRGLEKGPVWSQACRELLGDIYVYTGFPGGTSSKESACQCRRHSVPGLGRSGGELGNTFQCSCLEPGGLQTIESQSQTQLKQLSMCICTHIYIHICLPWWLRQ